METSLKKIKDILKKEIGLDAETLGDATINKILHQRMFAQNIDNIKDYYHLIMQNNDELAALLETAVIPETWFFRDTRPFSLISEHIKQQSETNKTCNILCIPCSTGEEPYSIAMHLLQSGITNNAFKIHAVDISHRALSLAEQAVYGKNSFRNETALEYKNIYFEHENGRDILKKNIKKSVNFSKISILNESGLHSLNETFDFIFCRNLLIYFDIKTKEKAFKNLHDILNDNGMLFIGHSEFGSVPDKLFTICGNNKAFGLIKYNKTHEDKKNKNTNIISHQIYKQPLPLHTSKKTSPLSFKGLIQSVNVDPVKKNINHSNNPETDLLNHARHLADQKKLSEAESVCFEFIDQYSENAECFFILGLINETSQHNNMAEDFFRKSIYLNPKHYESLLHLSLLLKNTGDKKSAELLMKRAQRINDNKPL